MGNRVAVSVPSQILPIDNYLKDLQDIKVKTSLGNTCFLKVACCSSTEGSVVAKVFVNHELGVNLEPYRDLLHRVHAHLHNAAPNCLMYADVKITDSAGILLRQHVDSSLHERISTRPFLSHLEKTWLAFQLLCALRQAHQAQVYHGDIKSENVLVTGCGWLQLADFAPYKPITLPDNDPSDFTYFFDTSRRRTCYIAPERFLRRDGDGRDGSPENAPSSGGSDPSATPGTERETSQPPNPTALNAAMDIFSAGCVLVELFTEVDVPFDLTRLLAYRKDQYHPQKLMDKIENRHVQSLLLSMLSRDPAGRQSAGDYLEDQRGLAFPDYFYSFLWPYCKQFAGHPKRAPDHTIKQLAEGLNDILLHVGGEAVAELDEAYCQRNGLSTGRGDCYPSYRLTARRTTCEEGPGACPEPGVEHRCEALVLVLPMITAAYRTCVLCSSKLLGLETLMRVARFCPDTVILDRLLPTLLLGLECSESSVRACAVDCITHCLTLVCSLPRPDANIFPEYIVPSLAKLTSDPCVIVRQALAENISTIADTSRRFLNWSLQRGYFSNREYEVEMQTLFNALQQVVTQIIMDQSNAVKRTFMSHTQGHLWTFFGLARANELIMTHLITYLNDVHDHRLRSDFFECLRTNAVMIGPYQGDIILPLLMQGMYDSEECVVEVSMGALAAMTREDIFTNAQLFEVLTVTLPLLLHPNTIISQSVVRLLCMVCQQLDPVEVLASVRPLAKPYIRPRAEVKDFCNQLCVLSALAPPIPREHWQTLLSFHDLKQLLVGMRDALAQTRFTLAQFLDTCMHTANNLDGKTLRRLLSLGLEGALIQKILALEQHLLRMHSHRRATQTHGQAGEGGSHDDRGEIQVDFAALQGRVAPPEIFRFNLKDYNTLPPSIQQRLSASGGGLGVSPSSEDRPPAAGAGRGTTPSPGVASVGPHTASNVSGEGGSASSLSSTPGGRPPATATASDTLTIVSDCEAANRQVVANRFQQYRSYSARVYRHTPSLVSGGGASTSPTPAWQPEGVLIAHLHEHTARVHRLCAVDGESLFASASHDGTVRIWDAVKTEREYPINRSKGVYGRLGGSVRSLAACHTQKSIAAASTNGNIHVFRMDKLSMQCDRLLDKDEDGYAVDMAFYDTGCGESVVVYGSVTGAVVGWDLRQPGTAWRFNNGPKNGLITSLMMDRDNNFVGVATNKGCITCWDIRFHLPLTKIKHEHSHHIRRLVKNPCDPRTAFAAATGNNEVGLWELDSSYRRQTLWASPKPPLSHKEPSSKNINGLCVCRSGGESSSDVFVVTGGSDCCLRYWNLQQPSTSRVLAHAALDHPNYPDTAFREVRSKESGNTIIVEDRSPNHRKESQPGATSQWVSTNNPADLYDPHRPASGHRDTITDIISVDLPQRLIVSSDAMGVIKIWK